MQDYAITIHKLYHKVFGTVSSVIAYVGCWLSLYKFSRSAEPGKCLIPVLFISASRDTSRLVCHQRKN